MIPPFTEDGFLPPGIHPATLEAIAERFGSETELRKVQMESIHWLVEYALKAGITRIIINGSFITDAAAPNDVDILLEVSSVYPLDRQAAFELKRGLPFIVPEHADSRFFAEALQVYAVDRHYRPKGVIEVIGWYSTATRT